MLSGIGLDLLCWEWLSWFGIQGKRGRRNIAFIRCPESSPLMVAPDAAFGCNWMHETCQWNRRRMKRGAEKTRMHTAWSSWYCWLNRWREVCGQKRVPDHGRHDCPRALQWLGGAWPSRSWPRHVSESMCFLLHRAGSSCKPCQSYSQDSDNFKLVSMPVDYVDIDMDMIFEWMGVELSLFDERRCALSTRISQRYQFVSAERLDLRYGIRVMTHPENAT